MSRFLGTTSGTAGVGIQQAANDIRLWPRFASHDGPRWHIPVDHLDGFGTGWWPGAGGMDASGAEWHVAVRWEMPEITRGHSGRLGFTGVTRDVWRTAVAGTVVKLFRTVDDSLQSSTVSAADGTYTLTTPFSDAHYLVAYKDDVIDTAGATVNTLIPA